MIASEANLWGIHAGRTGDANTLLLKKNRIGIGWAKIGDLSTLTSTREAISFARSRSNLRLIDGEDRLAPAAMTAARVKLFKAARSWSRRRAACRGSWCVRLEG